MKKGFVYLVGAGPGRPDLLTLRGAECLKRADAVVTDALVDRRVLEYCPKTARVIHAGKRGHGRILMKQPAINRLLVQLARQGKVVVRLKGGDPYFFGRGGEEAEHLAAHKVPFEVVPGVSSVNAVPSFAGIPLTHRGYTSTVTVVTGHAGIQNPYLRETRKEQAQRRPPKVEWDKLSPENTLVVLMGVKQLPDIVDRLREAGWPVDTPACVTQWGTFPSQKTVTGTLGDIAARVRQARLGAPGVIVLGSVVGLRPKLNWFERLPLFNKTVMVTRAQTQASALTRLLEERGARVLESPAIEIKPLPLSPLGRRFLRDLFDYDGVLFTSANAAEIFLKLWNARPWPPKTFAYAVGPKTAQVLVEGGVPVRGMAKEFVAESLLELLGEAGGKNFLFPRAAEGRDTLAEGLKARGARVDVWPLYRTVPARLDPSVRKALLAGEVDCVTFTSSSTAHSLMKALTPAQRKAVFKKTLAASIGPVTSQTLKSYGVRPIIAAKRSTVEDLAEAIEKSLGHPKKFQGSSHK